MGPRDDVIGPVEKRRDPGPREVLRPKNFGELLPVEGDPVQLTGAVRQVMRDLGADPPRDIRTMDAIRSGSVAQRRFMLMLVGTFGVIALGLAGLGVFGVVTLIAAERTAEVGIRLALGATPTQVMGLVLSQALQLAAAGILIGGVASLLLAPVLEAQLFGTTGKDPVTYNIVLQILQVEHEEDLQALSEDLEMMLKK